MHLSSASRSPAKTESITGSFRSITGVDIFTRAWLPASSPSAAILLLHGYAEHAGRYAHIAAPLMEAGFAVFAPDHSGHGRSGGRRGDIPSLDVFISDSYRYFLQIRQKMPSATLFIFGHSMGGTIALQFARKHQREFSGLILTAPLIRLPGRNASALYHLSRLMAAIAPTLPVMPFAASQVCSDPAVVQAYVSDPLVYHGRIRSRMGHVLLKACNDLQAHLEEITVPFWLGQGMADSIVDPDGALLLYQRAHSADKTFRQYPGLFHEILNEPASARILSEIIEWIRARV